LRRPLWRARSLNMPRPISATIDSSALRHNYLLAKRLAGEARCWAVVKANAYGHGLMRAARAWGDLADGFALLDLDEAVRLREAGIRQPVLLLEGCFEPADLDVVLAHDLSCVVHSEEQIAMLRAARPARPLSLLVKVNTGMNRLGLRPERLPAALDALAFLPAGSTIGLMTHFADGERGVAGQAQVFAAAARRVNWDGSVSLANSAALLFHGDTRADWVRPGIMLYGGSPAPELQSAAGIGLRPAMTLEAQIIAVQDVAPGERVGYGGLFQAQRPMRIGVVACGYADGYPRHAPTGTPLALRLADGPVRTRLLGRVSMDMLCVDLTDVAAAGVGTPVVLWGEGLPADEVAAAAGTISYELFCALAARVPVREA